MVVFETWKLPEFMLRRDAYLLNIIQRQCWSWMWRKWPGGHPRSRWSSKALAFLFCSPCSATGEAALHPPPPRGSASSCTVFRQRQGTMAGAWTSATRHNGSKSWLYVVLFSLLAVVFPTEDNLWKYFYTVVCIVHQRSDLFYYGNKKFKTSSIPKLEFSVYSCFSFSGTWDYYKATWHFTFQNRLGYILIH